MGGFPLLKSNISPLTFFTCENDFWSCQLTLKQLHMPLPSLISTLYSANTFLILKYGLKQLLNSFLGFTNVITYNWNDTYLYGKSPVCRREWRLSSLRSLKLFSHMVHKYGLSPEKKNYQLLGN